MRAVAAAVLAAVVWCTVSACKAPTGHAGHPQATASATGYTPRCEGRGDTSFCSLQVTDTCEYLVNVTGAVEQCTDGTTTELHALHTYGGTGAANAGWYVELPGGHWCGYEVRGNPGAFCDVD